jgi:GNAT superfamily N-acetyltransferase
MEVRPAAEADRPWLAECCRRAFGSPQVAAGGRLLRPGDLPALIAWEGGRRIGALAFEVEAGGAQVVLLAAEPPGGGAGTALLAALELLGRARGWRRLRLLTTNDNTPALRFYQRRGWDLAALHRDAVARDRLLKPEIPAVGHGGIAIRHALELERVLEPGKELLP